MHKSAEVRLGLAIAGIGLQYLCQPPLTSSLIIFSIVFCYFLARTISFVVTTRRIVNFINACYTARLRF
jgi:hypothetical protein